MVDNRNRVLVLPGRDGGGAVIRPNECLAGGEEEILSRLTNHDPTFAPRDVRAVILEASTGVPIDEALQTVQRLSDKGELLELTDGKLTTRAHRLSEHRTIILGRSLAAKRVSPIPESITEREIHRLQLELAKQGSVLSEEQRRAITAGCSDRQLVMIEGQAGTGKSTLLTALARAHQADDRKIIVTSTAALAAQRLASELQIGGVSAVAHPTAALHATSRAKPTMLSERTTVIHDEAALASTREQQALLQAVHESGARLIEVGDPQQSQPVGAGGLWTGLEECTRSNLAHVHLTRNVRALDPDDRRDQRLFRDGRIEEALAGYSERGRIHLTSEQRQAEDQALEAAHRRAERPPIARDHPDIERPPGPAERSSSSPSRAGLRTRVELASCPGTALRSSRRRPSPGPTRLPPR
jgi:ATP-dependent exoDNAse (exonuclease V) alpha subunit